MISLAQALEDQKDLTTLCQPKSANRYERYIPNDNYGQAHILKTYAGYPVEKSLNFTFPHGVYLRDNVIATSELNADFPAHLNFPPFLTALWKKTAKHKKVLPMAAPIHYALKLFEPEVKADDRKGTLFVPVHSTSAVDVQFSQDAVIKELKALPEDYQPITLCVHWADVAKGQHLAFQKEGFDVVCAGHLSDSNFLFRWLHLVSQFKLMVGCGIGSSLFYSILAGTPYLLTKEDIKAVFHPEFKPFKKAREYTPTGQKRLAHLHTIFGELVNQPTKQQIDLVNWYTQKDQLLLPSDLNKLIRSWENKR